jgi:glyoxylase-like metal-dependent hydrolase (beta-lactamase superfamily II)/ACT domain-containing protein
MSSRPKNTSAAVKIYKSLSADSSASLILAKFRIELPDRPGSLAGFASTITQANGNISFFHYDRSVNSNRVTVEVQLPDESSIAALVTALREREYRIEEVRAGQDDVAVTAIESVLEIKVRLENKPGALAGFARLLAGHDANVISLLYDEDIDPESANIALATSTPREIDRLLHAVNEQGYHYRVVYSGSDEQTAAQIIGLKVVERFFLRLKKLLPSSSVAEIKSLVDSSRELQQDLARFTTAADNNLEAGDVFETVLTFASRSRSRIGEQFTVGEMKPLRFLDQVDLFGFRMPTSENFYVLRSGHELVMIDAAHGIYYPDIKALLRSRGMDPAQVRRVYVTHPDTDHAGAAGYFEREFGTTVYMHAGSADVISNMNRASGARGSLLNLNKYYTRLSARFTECLFPSHPRYFAGPSGRSFGQFNTLDTFSVGPLAFDVLESMGGHTPGLVFFLNREFGLLFTSDFLLNVKSLTAEDKEHLGIYKYLLTTPNRDSRVYREETAALKDLILDLNRELKAKQGGKATVFPGHGNYYSADELQDDT